MTTMALKYFTQHVSNKENTDINFQYMVKTQK